MNNDIDIPEKIDLDELYDRKQKLTQNRINTYKMILARAHTRIKTTARQKCDEQFCFFLMPEFIIGLPKYNIETCVSYVTQKLKDNGFHVKYTHPNLLFISWKHYIPAHERHEIKTKTGVLVDGFGKKVVDESKKQEIIVKKKPAENYKDISSYKPSGIYNMDLMNRIRNKMD